MTPSSIRFNCHMLTETHTFEPIVQLYMLVLPFKLESNIQELLRQEHLPWQSVVGCVLFPEVGNFTHLEVIDIR